jgi:PadR family transcriptional regulator, regulatory protein AphA
MELNPTSYVILGMLGLKPMCGYDIKQLVDNSTRFFWAASYGQIYPELRRLSESGLIKGRPDSGTARGRIEFELTDEGRRTLEQWLAAPSEIQEMRDESMLKIFFSGTAGNGGIRAALEAKRNHHRGVADRLRGIEESAQAADATGGPVTALRLGIAFNEFVAQWCDREASSS